MRKTEKFAVLACFGLGLACVFISIARFIMMYTIGQYPTSRQRCYKGRADFLDLLSNLTGTSLTTFMLCSVELMLAGMCINIPMLRPFYLQWRAKYKDSSLSNSGRRSAPLSGPLSGPLKSEQDRPGHYTQWLELVGLSSRVSRCEQTLTLSSMTRTKPTSQSPMTTQALKGNSQHLFHHTTRFTSPRTGR